MPTRRPSTRPDGLLTPENLVPVERGTRWSCRQCGAERAAAWRRERFTEGFEQLVENRQRALAMAAAMIGGVAASRAVAKADPKLSNQILRARPSFTHSSRRGYWRNPSLSNRQIDDRGASRQGHICVPHPLIITESNKRESAEISAKKTTDLV